MGIIWTRKDEIFKENFGNLLNNHGSFTKILQELDNKSSVQVNLIQNKFVSPYLWMREVILSLNNHQVMYAISLFPKYVVEHYYANIISDEPIGLWLFKDSTIIRKNVRYAHVNKDHIAVGVNLPTRRSILSWSCGKLLIYESILPDIMRLSALF